MFPGYYRLSDEELAKWWDNCIFVPDANILLNLYRYSRETTDQFITILKQVSDRLWVPHQVALEYHRNRLTVIAAQAAQFDKITTKLDKAITELEKDLGVAKHLLDPVTSSLLSAKQELETRKKQNPDLFENDPIRDALTALLEGRVGPPYPESALKAIFEEGKRRYAEKRPPGFEDEKEKPGDEKYGDLVLWKQTIDKGKQEKKPVILVTEDTKSDWWWEVAGKTIGPRPELIEEMLQEAQTQCYIYRAERFVQFAQQYLRSKIDEQAIQEVTEVARQDDRVRRAARRRSDSAEELFRSLRTSRGLRPTLNEPPPLTDEVLRYLSSSDVQRMLASLPTEHLQTLPADQRIMRIAPDDVVRRHLIRRLWLEALNRQMKGDSESPAGEDVEQADDTDASEQDITDGNDADV